MYHIENKTVETSYTPLDEVCAGGTGYFCFHFMKKHGDKLAQIDILTGHKETYYTFLKKCIRTAIVLQKMGIQKEDVVAFCSETNLNSCVPLVACFLIGAVPSYIDTTFPVFEFTHFINAINPKLFLVTPDFYETVQGIVKEGGTFSDIAIFNENFFKPTKQETNFTPIRVDDLQQTAVIHFSSGSTGFPKGICMNHYVLVCNGRLDDILAGQVVLSYDSFHWCAETFRLMRSMSAGACRLVCSEAEFWKTVWHTVIRYKVNIIYMSPWDLITALEIDKPEGANMESLCTVYVEGSLLPSKYYERLQNFLPGVDIFHTYGQTETGRLTTFKRIDSHREYIRNNPECIGIPISGIGTCLKVVNSETGEVLGPNQKGELRIKSRSLMNGYFNKNSSDQFDENSWLKTGDMVYYNEDFCFFFVGRIKDVILYQDWHVLPALLENELLSHPAVKFAVVIGVPDERDTEHALALIVLHDNVDAVTANEIKKFVENRVPSKYRLAGGVKIISELYLKTGNKIKRSKLKQLVLSGKI